MATKFLLIALICALVFAHSNSTRLGMEKSGPPLLGKKIWHHFPHFGGGLGGKGVGLGHRPGGAAFGGGTGNFAGGNGGGTGGERGFSGRNGGSDGGEGKGEVVDHGGDEVSGKDGSAGGVP